MNDLRIEPPGTMTSELVELHERVERKLDECMAIYPLHQLSESGKRPRVVYDLRGKHAGYAWGGDTIRLNIELLHDERYTDSMIDDTLVHEFAHIVVQQLYPGSRGHGETWKAAARKLGIEPRRCHDYEVTPARVHPRPWLYTCSCQDHYVTARIHGRIVRGYIYTCRGCGERLG